MVKIYFLDRHEIMIGVSVILIDMERWFARWNLKNGDGKERFEMRYVGG